MQTNAEWEYACFAGSTGSYGFGEPAALLKEYGQYILNASGRAHPVESLLPNEAGLFDMRGNLWEWTQDAVSGPMSPVARNGVRFLRGGAFNTASALVQHGIVDYGQPGDRTTKFGFRPVRTFHLSSP